jgi:Aldehyde dehydrogenase family
VAFAKVLRLAGLDVRLLRILSEDTYRARAAIAAGVDKVLLTGSAATGAAVLTELTPRLIPTTLELSGCDAAFVRQHADLAAQALAGRIRAGVVVVNDVIVPTADPRLPFGGRGQSGFGVTRSAEGLLELTAVKAVATRHGRWHPHFDGSAPEDTAFFQLYIVAAHDASLARRVAAGWRLVRAIVSRTRQRQGPRELQLWARRPQTRWAWWVVVSAA